jgi:D-lactate dehydrogenase
MKLHICGISEHEQSSWQEHFEKYSVSFSSTTIDPSGKLLVPEDTNILSVFVNNPVSNELIRDLQNLKLIATRSTGYDHINAEAAEQNNVTVVNVPEYGSRTVAEYTFALLLALSRGSYRAYDHLRTSGKTNMASYEGFDLYSKTIGIIGTGRIGQHVCKIANGFGMHVIAFDPYPNVQFATANKIEYTALDELLEKSDIISLHAPHNDTTHHLLNKSNLSNVKTGAYLINTARGELIDTAALLAVLQSGTLAGAALDVIEGEDFIYDEALLLTDKQNDINVFYDLAMTHALLDMENVILTPHIAFNTIEAKERIVQTTVKNIESYIKGEIINLVK